MRRLYASLNVFAVKVDERYISHMSNFIKNNLPCQVAKIYLVENMVNHRKYVGFTIGSVAARWRRHVYDANRNSRFHLHRAIRKHGKENFQISEIYCSTDILYTLHEMEPYFIEQYNSYGCGYNMTIGGDGVIGSKRIFRPIPPSVKQKMREWWTPERRAEASKRFSELPRTEEHKAHIAAALKGRKRSPEEIEKLRNALTGRKLSPERVQKMRDRVVSVETRQKMSVVRKGKRQNPLFVEKRAAANRGQKRTPEQIEKNRQTQLALHRKDSTETLRKKREARAKYLQKNENSSVREWILWYKNESRPILIRNIEKWAKEHGMRGDSLQKVARGARETAYGYRVWRRDKAPDDILQILSQSI